MKRNQLFAIFAFVIAWMLAGNVNAQFGDLINKAKDKVDKATKKAEQKKQPTTSGNPVQNGQNSGGNQNASDDDKSGKPYSVYNTQTVNKSAKPGEVEFVGLSKKPIDPNNLGATEWATNFASGDHIYGIVYLPQPLSEYLTISNHKTNKKDMVIDCFHETGEPSKPGGNKRYSVQTSLCARIYVTPETINQTFSTFAIFPDPKSKFSFSEGISGYSNVRYFLEDAYQEARKYDMAMRFRALGTFETVAEVEGITTDFSNKAPYVAMKPAYEKSQGQEMSKQVEDKPLEPTAMNNPAMQKQFMTLLASRLGQSKLLKMNILSPQWQVVRHEVTGVIVGRYIATRSIVRESEGFCRTRYGLFMQDANGSGYNQTYVNSFGATDDWVIPCERAK